MADEVYYQREWVIREIKKEGGHGKKLSNKFLTGIPDLLLAYPEFPNFLVEVKYLKNVKLGFKRKIEITPLQVKQLEDYQGVNPGIPCTAIFVLYELSKRKFITAVTPTTTSIQHGIYPTTGGDIKKNFDFGQLFREYTQHYLQRLHGEEQDGGY